MVDKIGAAFGSLVNDNWENIGFIFGSLNPADWLVRLIVINLNAIQKTALELSEVPFTIAAEIALEASDALPSKKLHQRVMPLDSAFKMVFRIGAERFRDSVQFDFEPIIGNALSLRSAFRDSLQKKLLKRLFGTVYGLVNKSWSTIWKVTQLAVKLWGAFFFLIFWALLADYILKHANEIRDRYCLPQDTPRVDDSGIIRRRKPGGVSP